MGKRDCSCIDKDSIVDLKSVRRGRKCMNIPELKRNDRDREFNKYSKLQRGQVVYAMLFEGKTHREIDREVLNLDSGYTKGYQSMGILHYLGLGKKFRGLFQGMTIDEGIDQLENVGKDKFKTIIDLLQSIIWESEIENDIKSETEEIQGVYIDGHCARYYTTRYERNPKNRKRAIEIHGTTCMVCGFNFEKFYGAIGKNYIEVHHIIPLASINEEIEINPEQDLVVLCANCHRMIHRKKDHVLTVSELKQFMLKAENRNVDAP